KATSSISNRSGAPIFPRYIPPAGRLLSADCGRVRTQLDSRPAGSPRQRTHLNSRTPAPRGRDAACRVSVGATRIRSIPPAAPPVAEGPKSQCARARHEPRLPPHLGRPELEFLTQRYSSNPIRRPPPPHPASIPDPARPTV